MWLGLGSNLLVRDGGFRGTVIATATGLKAIQCRDRQQVWVQCGVPCAKVARFTVKLGLAGGEFLAGIPGAMGGALAMNAGAFGGETWDLVESVEVMDRSGAMFVRRRDEFEVAYRHVSGRADEWFVGAVLSFHVGDPQAGMARIKALLEKRSDAQPTGQASCGSVFRNPPGDYAARLIEVCGLKGQRVGGAMISPKHANFIVNVAAATARDIETLIDLTADTVFRQTGVRLLREVQIVGEKAEQRRR